MNILSAQGLSKSYTARMLFEDADFSMQEGDKVGVIGINGTGKSTLLKILAGQEEADGGKVVTSAGLVIGYLSQTPTFPAGIRVLDAVLSGDKHGESDREGRAKSLLTRFALYDYQQKVEELSGGQKKRVALVQLLLRQADLLILDEPTNHLDQEMAAWLEEYLRTFRGSVLMVTHDRYFLDSVCNRILEVDKGAFYSYEENYAGYLEKKALREEMAASSERKRQSILRTELAWIQRGARARSTKQKGRIQRFEELSARKAPETDEQLSLGSIASRMGRTTIELEHITKGYGDRTLIEDFSYIFLKRDRVGFVGQNGCGKTTLMRIIAGKGEPDSGRVIVGQTVKIGYYAQELSTGAEEMPPEMKVIDYIKDVAEYIQTGEGLVSASKMLEQFLFPSTVQYSQIGKLSGGEKRRLRLLRVLMGAPNVLILDEPTNDLDITTMTVLEDFLDHFEGIVIAVSHDRYFLDRTVNRIFAFEDGQICQYEGGYTDYQQKVLEKGYEPLGGKKQLTPAAPVEKSDAKKTWKNGPKKLKFTWQEQKDFETIEGDIAALEAQLEELDAEMAANATDFAKLKEITLRKEETQQKLDEKMDRWMYLEELAERINNQE